MWAYRCLVMVLGLLATGCASRYFAYQGHRPKSDVAIVRIDPNSQRLKFGSIDGVSLAKSVHEVHVLPGTHSIGLRGFTEQGAPLGITFVDPQRGSLSIDAEAGHFYIVKAVGTNVGEMRFTPWIEDRATHRVVAGKRGFGARY